MGSISKIEFTAYNNKTYFEGVIWFWHLIIIK